MAVAPVATIYVQHVQNVFENMFSSCEHNMFWHGREHVFGMCNIISNKKHKLNMQNMPEHAKHAFNHAIHAEHATTPRPYHLKRQGQGAAACLRHVLSCLEHVRSCLVLFFILKHQHLKFFFMFKNIFTYSDMFWHVQHVQMCSSMFCLACSKRVQNIINTCMI